MTREREITLDYVQSVLRYEAGTGHFYWTTDRTLNNGGIFARAGDRAGTAGVCYRQIKFRVRGRAIPIKEHRLAWFVYHKQWPTGWLDHINGDTRDNRISNLREATHTQNMANRGKPRHSKSPYKGVTFNRRMQRWQARIQVGNCRVHLGSFHTAEAAHAAYSEAALRFQGRFAHLESVSRFTDSPAPGSSKSTPLGTEERAPEPQGHGASGARRNTEDA